MKIHADPITRKVMVNGVYLDPKPSQKIMNHSPDGFAWGYSGSGPAQLALALTVYAAEMMDVPFGRVRQFYQEVKSEFVANWPKDEEISSQYNIEGYLWKRIKEVEGG